MLCKVKRDKEEGLRLSRFWGSIKLIKIRSRDKIFRQICQKNSLILIVMMGAGIIVKEV
jgi:hypothetical protein